MSPFCLFPAKSLLVWVRELLNESVKLTTLTSPGRYVDHSGKKPIYLSYFPCPWGLAKCENAGAKFDFRLGYNHATATLCQARIRGSPANTMFFHQYLCINKAPAVAALALMLNALGAQSRLSDYVDPLIGTEGPIPGSSIAGGNAFPGAALPWSMAKAGIDTSFLGLRDVNSTDCNAGYTPLGNVTAVSMMHVSGTGGVPTCISLPIRALSEELKLTSLRWPGLTNASPGNFTLHRLGG